MKKPSIKKKILIVAGLLAGAILLISGPLPDEASRNGLRLLATVLSIFSGFIMAVITITGNQENLYRGSWRLAYRHSCVARK